MTCFFLHIYNHYIFREANVVVDDICCCVFILQGQRSSLDITIRGLRIGQSGPLKLNLMILINSLCRPTSHKPRTLISLSHKLRIALVLKFRTTWFKENPNSFGTSHTNHKFPFTIEFDILGPKSPIDPMPVNSARKGLNFE